MTTIARTYADRLDTLDSHRQAAYGHVGMGKIYAAAHQMRRRCATEAEALAKNLTAVDQLTTGIPGLPEADRAVALGIAAQGAISAIRALTREEVQAMSLTDLVALLNDPNAHPIESEIGVDDLHDRYMKHIGVDAYDALLRSWITNGTSDHEVRAHILTELGAA